MRAFVDTSTLFKMYYEEAGSEDFKDLLEKISEIIVSPICWLEMNTTIHRLLNEKRISREQVKWLKEEMNRDFQYFSKIIWNENLETAAVEIGSKYYLKTLDSIQLAASALSKADLFITSDVKLYREAEKILKKVQFIGSQK